MAEANSLRYRGYYYDRETGFYYLNSRYYDPKIGRFINADSYVSTGQGIVGYNMFAYCGNNPVNREDAEGRFWDTFFDIFSLGVSIYDVFTDPTDGWAWAGLVGDAVDLIPFITGVGEGTKALGVVNKVDNVHDAAKTTNKTEDMLDLVDGACFVAGTLVLTATGYVCIEDICEGEIVWSENPETGEKEFKKVVQTFERETKELVHVFVDGEEIITTPFIHSM